MRTRYYHWALVSLSVLSLGLAYGTIRHNSLVFGIATGLSYLLYRRQDHLARLRGRTVGARILHAVGGNLIEFTGIAAGALVVSTSWPILLALAAVGFRQSFSWELHDKTSVKYSELFGRPERITVLTVTLLLSFFNHYVLFYGYSLLALMALAESVRQILHVWRKQRP
ncbi:MAG: hypothetical protein ABEJ95_02915 [Candidatus Nanohalobium sp.]